MRLLYHPFAVHFPIALWLASGVFDAVYVIGRDRFYDRAARFLIGMGLVGAVVSIILGFMDFLPLALEGIGQAFVDAHRQHSTFAYATIAVYLLSFLLRWWRPNVGRGVVGVLLVLGGGLIVATAWFGTQVRGVM